MDQLNIVIEKFNEFVQQIVPEDKQDQLVDVEKMKKNVYLLIKFLPEEEAQLKNQVEVMKSYFGIEHLTDKQNNRLNLFMKYFVSIKQKIGE